MHSAGLELTKLTYIRLEDNLIRHRGDRSIQVCECAFALHQEQKRDHFGTAVAIDVHRMFHHDPTALTTRASGLAAPPLVCHTYRE